MTTRDEKSTETGSPLRRVWRSIFRGPVVPKSDRERKWVVLNHLILHFRPVSLPKKTLSYTHTFGLGGMSLVLVTMLLATGLLLNFAYEPSPERAYNSIVSLQNDILFGKLIRNVHHWSANILILIVSLHLLRVYFTGGFLGPRQFNWLIGLALLGFILTSNFTGYLLPWDQLSYWAVTISTAMVVYVPFVGNFLQGVIRGGPDIGPAALVNFHALHTTVVPFLLIVLMAFHFWRVRKAHGVVVPRSDDEAPDEQPEYVLFLPNLLLRELTVALILIAFVLTVSVAFDAPFGLPANPGMSPNPAKAPWYFVGIQELLLHLHPVFSVVILPMAAVGALVVLPYLRYDVNSSGVLFVSPKGRRMALLAALTALLATPTAVVVDELSPDWTASVPGIPPVVSDGLVPSALLAGAVAGFHKVLKKKFCACNNEAIQATFVLLLLAFVVLTLVGVWFRGRGMALVWPWNL